MPTSHKKSAWIPVADLTPAAFASFGEVVQNPATHAGEPGHVRGVEANQGSATKWVDVAGMRSWYGAGGRERVGVNMFVCRPRGGLVEDGEGRRGFEVRVLERHPYTPQMFVPMGLGGRTRRRETRYLVIVAPTLSDTTLASTSSSSSYNGPKGSGRPDLKNLQAFVARGDQAVTYGAGTWHAPMVVLGEEAVEFVVVQHLNGVAEDDCQEVEIGEEEGLVVDVSTALRENDDTLVKAKL